MQNRTSLPAHAYPCSLSRSALRKTLREQRRALSTYEQSRASARLFWRLSRHQWLRSAKNIAVYLSSDGEISPSHLSGWATKNRKYLYLPCIDAQTKTMSFKRYIRTTPLKNNIYGISEPREWVAQNKSAHQMDVILMPLVGFDISGNRLGMGGGYYDKALANIPAHTRLIGLAHAQQQVHMLAKEPWDVSVQLIATDKGLFTPQKHSAIKR